MNYKHRGIGRTALMIDTLPEESCVVVVPSPQIGVEISKRIEKSRRKKGTWRVAVIREIGDSAVLGGIEEPVFFDHSFWDAVREVVAMEAVTTARICSERARWKKIDIAVRKLPLGDTTPDGPYYPVVNGNVVGEKDRQFWKTHDEAYAAAERWVKMATGFSTQKQPFMQAA